MIKTYTRDSKFIETQTFCHFAKEHDFIEITEWYNGEGFDFNINGNSTTSLTWGQWAALQKLLVQDDENT